MPKSDLLFYDAYQEFYSMAETSESFRAFCRDAFGEDFSQDGFSDIWQVKMILDYIPKNHGANILDIGCGNGKMLGFLQKAAGVNIYGFDYSEHAISTAKKFFMQNAYFRVGVIGEIDYPAEMFDAIISMDTMYFAKDMSLFVGQIKNWLKPNGVFFAGYQEGDVMPKTENHETTVLAKSLVENQMKYEVQNITRQTYDLLIKKRSAALAHKAEFLAEGFEKWYDMLMLQTECVTAGYDEFARKMARYIFVARK